MANKLTNKARSPYSRPFEHERDCSCSDCAWPASRPLLAALVFIVIAIAAAALWWWRT